VRPRRAMVWCHKAITPINNMLCIPVQVGAGAIPLEAVPPRLAADAVR
jgi:hypothetical protein